MLVVEIFCDILFPTCVGMNRPVKRLMGTSVTVPHVRGDEPLIKIDGNDYTPCSPRAWG